MSESDSINAVAFTVLRNGIKLLLPGYGAKLAFSFNALHECVWLSSEMRFQTPLSSFLWTFSAGLGETNVGHFFSKFFNCSCQGMEQSLLKYKKQNSFSHF